jgi:hypothetical protein
VRGAPENVKDKSGRGAIARCRAER